MHSDSFVIQGTLIEGPSVDLIALSGVQLTEGEEEKIWEEISPRTLLVEILDCEEIELEEFDEVPGMSDKVYEYRCGPREEFIERLSDALLHYAGKNT